MGLHSLCSRVGIHIRAFSWILRESFLDWASRSGHFMASAGAGVIGHSIGTAGGEWSSTTTRTSRVVRLSSIEIISVRIDSIFVAQIRMAEVLPAIRRSIRLRHHIFQKEHILGPSADLGMADLRGVIAREDSRALAASTEEAEDKGEE